MKMVKSLLLGSAAGFVAVAGAQAADLPVKAKAANPVLICSLYGKGFYYIPGSDMCLSITGFTRFQIYGGTGNGQFTAATAIAPGGVASGNNQWSNTNTPFSSNNGLETRAGFQNDLTYRTRVMMTLDARQQTAYGTLRSVVTAGYTNDIASTASQQVIYANRGFIQIAGFTLGKAVSFYDLYASPAYTYFAVPSSDTGDGGQMVGGYTFQFGGGVSATIAAEEARRNNIVNTGTFVGSPGVIVTGSNLVTSVGLTDNVQYRYPDLVGALRWDQAWGAFQVMGALHDASGGYYISNGATNTATTMNAGHPGDKWGFALGAGLKLNIGADVFDSQFNYTEGATKYLSTGVTPGGAFYTSNGATLTTAGTFGYGIVADGIYGTNAGGVLTGVNLTTAWGFNAAYDHRWSPALKTSVYGGYMSWKFNSEATGMMCNNSTSVVAATGSGISAFASACNQDWQQWFIGSRTQWDVARSFYVGVDVLYTKLQTANAGATTGTGFSPGTLVRPAGNYSIKDQDAWAFTFRAHRDIVP